MIVRLRYPYATCHLFATGKMVLLGLRSEFECRQAARIVARKLQNAGMNVDRLHHFQIKSVTARLDVGYAINLYTFAEQYPDDVHYVKELNPGAQIEWKDLELQVVVYGSGKVLFMGAKTRDGIYEAWRRLAPMVMLHKNVYRDIKREKNAKLEKMAKHES